MGKFVDFDKPYMNITKSSFTLFNFLSLIRQIWRPREILGFGTLNAIYRQFLTVSAEETGCRR